LLRSVLLKSALRAIACLIAFSMMLEPPVWAAQPVNSAAGQAFGQSIMPGAGGVPTDLGGGSYSLPGTGGVTIGASDLIPSNGQASTLQNAYGNNAAVISNANSSATAASTDPSAWGEAYRTLGGSVTSSSHPNLANDPIFNGTDQALTSVFDGTFNGCTQTQVSNSATVNHVPDIRHCVKPRTTHEICTIDHPAATALPSTAQCDPATFQSYTVTWTANAYAPPNCSFGASGIVQQVPHKITVSCTSNKKLRYDITANSNIYSSVLLGYLIGSYRDIYLGYYDNCNPATGQCISHPASGTTPLGSFGIGGHFFTQNTTNPARPTFTFELLTSTYSNLYFFYFNSRCRQQTRRDYYVTGTASMGRVTDTLNNRITDSQWSPASCIAIAKGIDQGTVHGSYTCTMNPAGQNGCYTIGASQVCPSDLNAPPVNVPATCGTVTVDYYPSVTTQDTCTQYETNPDCSFVSSAAIPGSEFTPGGAPGAYDVTYDCGYNVTVPAPPSNVTVSCPGMVDCADGSCITTNPESNPNFGQAASYLQSAATLQQDGQCDPVTGTCTVFPGTDLFCKDWEIFNNTIKNCCAQSVPVPDMTSYINMVRKMNAMENAVMMINKGSGMFGAWAEINNAIANQWDSLGNTVSQAFDTITQPITNAWESIAGTSSTNVAANGAGQITDAAAQGFMDQMMAAITQKTAEFVKNTFGNGAVDLLFAPAAGGGTASGALAAGQQVVPNPAITATLDWIMLAYTIYQLAVILINLIFKCDDPQFEYLMKKQLKTCHVVGMACANYVCVIPNPFGGCILGYCGRYEEHGCCFNSPLSRIIQEQVRPQLGMGWGATLTPNCSGLSLTQLQNVNWANVDLSEWEAILVQTGNWPTNGTLTTSSVTGAGSNFDVGGQPAGATIGTRQDLKTRTQNRLNTNDTNQIRNSVNQGMWGVVR